ncbi:MAG: hypothetical protein JWR61_1551 [Ferruginibacter sp.]|nr:hypothetical protein [Ferruginibacter sp.]
MKLNLTVILSLLIATGLAQPQKKVEVLTLGSFHFAFHNLDLIKTTADDQIDVLDPKYQKEIEDIVARIAKFKPTVIAIEEDPEKQAKYDSLYNQYLQGHYNLKRGEEEQIGFRIAKMMNLKRLNCVNAWGTDYEALNKVLDGKDSMENKKFMNYFNQCADTLKRYFPKPIFKTKGIKAELIQKNDPKNINSDLGTYLIGIFKYETTDNKFFGPDFVTGWWFNRNLRIFRNIQKISTTPADRVLVIFGAGHMTLLNSFFDASPEYKLLKVNDYLQ